MEAKRQRLLLDKVIADAHQSNECSMLDTGDSRAKIGWSSTFIETITTGYTSVIGMGAADWKLGGIRMSYCNLTVTHKNILAE